MLYIWVDYKDGHGLVPHISFEDNDRESADFEIEDLKDHEYEAKYGDKFPPIKREPFTQESTIHVPSMVKLAESKFGQVIDMIHKGISSGEYRLVIIRDDCPFPDKPYMSITYGVHGGFYSGHYDLTREHALCSIKTILSQAGV